MDEYEKIPVIREDDGELLGYISQETSGWAARTVFGYIIARSSKREDADATVRAQGLNVLKGIWRYYDSDEHDWFTCVLKEVYENRVVVTRTNDLGYEDDSHYKRVVLKYPSELTLQIA